MQVQPFKRIYTDNDHYADDKVADYVNIPYMDSLFSAVWEYLYKDGHVAPDDYGDFDFCMKGRIKPYNFMTLVFYFINASVTENGEATIEDYLENIGERSRNGEEGEQYPSDDSLLVTNASTELQTALVWTSYVYARIRNELGGGPWMEIATMLWGILQEKLLLIEKAFNMLYIVRNTENAVKTVCVHLLTKGRSSSQKQTIPKAPPVDSQNNDELDVLRRRVEAAYPKLYSNEAEACWRKLREAGYVDVFNQPLEKLTNERRASIAFCLAVKLGFENKKWAVFESYWGCKRMAQDHIEGIESDRIRVFESEILTLLEIEGPPKPKNKL